MVKNCPICNTEFEPKRRDQVYCGNKACSDEGRRRKQNVGEKKSPEQLAEKTLEQKILRKDAALEAAKRELKAARDELEVAQEELDAAKYELSLFDQEAPVAPEWALPGKETKHHRGTLVAFFSDSHYGEVVNPAELGGYNAYNLEIARLRTERFFTRTVRLARNYLAGVQYDGIVLALGGDLVSGDIHEELVETNELSTYDTVLETAPWIARGISMLAEEFKNVHVVSAPGNHGRNSKRPRHKKRSANNADTLLAKLVAWRLEDAPHVVFDIPASTDVDFEIYGNVFSLEHGDNLRFAGTSEIGALGPVKRGSLRKTKKRQEQRRPVKYNLFGHFHQYVPAHTQGFVMNGSLKGYDEFASDGQFAPEPAQQALMVVTPEHGITIEAPVFVVDREAEGW